MAVVTFRFFAGASRAMGTRVREIPLDVATPLGTLVEALGTDADQQRVLGLCTWLVDGRHAEPGDPVGPGATVDALPPFAGG